MKRLTEREREVLRLIAADKSNREIAEELQLTEDAIRQRVSRLLLKLGARSRVGLAVWWVTEGGKEGRKEGRRETAVVWQKVIHKIYNLLCIAKI